MKKFLFVFALSSLVLTYVSCKKDDDNIDDEPQGEVLPPDNEVITGTVEGTIHPTQYDENQSQTTVTISRLCHTVEKFVELQNQIAVTPQGAVVMVIVAMRIIQQYPIEGTKCLTATCTYPLTMESTVEGSYNGEIVTETTILKGNLTNYPRLPFIYYQGASPQNGYTPNGPPYVVKMYTNSSSYSQTSQGTNIKLFVETLGADSNRPCRVVKVGNIYKVAEFSSLYLSYKPITQ